MSKACDPDGPLMSSGKDDWQTPGKILDCVHELCAVIGLDPCAGRGTDIAVSNMTADEDGLSIAWEKQGLVFVNPPYSQLKLWVPKCVEEARKGTEVVLLIPARTDTIAFQLAMRWSNAVCFVAGRLKFLDQGVPCKNSAPFPNAVLYFGPQRYAFGRAFGTLGHVVDRATGWTAFEASHASSN